MAVLPCLLLVDDDATTNFLNQALLRRLAVADQVLVALDGQEALDVLRTHCAPPAAPTCPVLILLDLNMPRMNGVEFLRAYAQRPPTENPAVVIVMLTTSLNPRDVAQLQGLPIAGYFTKPLSNEKIAQILREHFDYPAPAAGSESAST